MAFACPGLILDNTARLAAFDNTTIELARSRMSKREIGTPAHPNRDTVDIAVEGHAAVELGRRVRRKAVDARLPGNSSDR